MPQVVDLFAYFSVVLRAGTLVFQSVVLGGVLFVLWTAGATTRFPVNSIATVQDSSYHLLRVAAIGLAVTQVLYLCADVYVLRATMEVGFRDVIGATFFIAGSIMLVGAVIMAAVAGTGARMKAVGGTLGAAIILIATVMTNHAAARIDGRPILIGLALLHELATGFWIGGLPFLILALFRSKDKTTQWHITERFSRSAMFSVGTLVATGVQMSVAYVGSPRSLFGTAYGVMVIAKVIMLGALLVLGGINYRLLKESSPEGAFPKLRRLIEAEVGIGFTVILTAASLTSQPPAVDMVRDTVTSQQIITRFTPTWPRLSYAPRPKSGAPVAELFSARAIESRAIATDVDGFPLQPKTVADIVESESNHHWMGLFVVLMGVLALLAQTRRVPWAEYWPLLLLAIAIFILLRADTESWPYGPEGFWRSWLRPEDFQHRLAALVCIGLAVFELRIRLQKDASSRLSLVFPVMCALGGALLLTHSHSLSNVKEQLLADLSHVPLGVAAVFAGWGRWLELRLPVEDRKVPSWTWRVCFVLIGAGLLNYREM